MVLLRCKKDTRQQNERYDVKKIITIAAGALVAVLIAAGTAYALVGGGSWEKDLYSVGQQVYSEMAPEDQSIICGVTLLGDTEIVLREMVASEMGNKTVADVLAEGSASSVSQSDNPELAAKADEALKKAPQDMSADQAVTHMLDGLFSKCSS